MLPMVDYMDSDHETVVDQRYSEPRPGDSISVSIHPKNQPQDLKSLLLRYLAWSVPENLQKRPLEHIVDPIDIKIMVNINGTEPETIKVSDTDGRTYFVSQILYHKVNEAITTANMKRDRIQKYKLSLTGVQVVERESPNGPILDFSMKGFGPELSQVKVEPPFLSNLITDPEIAKLWQRRLEMSQMERACKKSKDTDPRDPFQKLVEWDKLVNGSAPRDDESLQCETVTPHTLKTSRSRADRLKAGQKYAQSNFANIGSPDDAMTSVVECEESKDSSISKKEPKKVQQISRPPNPLLAKRPIFPSGASGSGVTGQSSQNVLTHSLTALSNSNNVQTQGSGGSDPSRNLMIDVLSCDEEPDTSSKVPPLNDRGFSSSGDDPEPPKVNILAAVKERDLERQLADKIKIIKDQEIAFKDRDRKIDILEKRVKELEKALKDKERAIKEHEKQIKEAVREALKEKEKQHSDTLKAAIENEQQLAANATLELKKQNEDLTKRVSVSETLATSLRQKYDDAKAMLKKYTSSNAEIVAKKTSDTGRVKTEPVAAHNTPIADGSKVKSVPNIGMLNSKLASMMASQMTPVTVIPSSGPRLSSRPVADQYNPQTHTKHTSSNPPGPRQPSQVQPGTKPSFENLNKMLAGGIRGVTNISESTEPKPTARRTEHKPSHNVTEVEDNSVLLGKRRPNMSQPPETRPAVNIHGGHKEKGVSGLPAPGVSKYSTNPAVVSSGTLHVGGGQKKVDSGFHTVPVPKESDRPQFAIRTSAKKHIEGKKDHLLDLEPVATAVQRLANPKQTSQSAPKTKEQGRERYVEAISHDDSPQYITHQRSNSLKKPVNPKFAQDVRGDSPSNLRPGGKQQMEFSEKRGGTKVSTIVHERQNSNSKSNRVPESRLEGYLETKRSKMIPDEPHKLRAKSQAVLRETSCSETSLSREAKKRRQYGQGHGVEKRKLLRNFDHPETRDLPRQSSGSVYKPQHQSRDFLDQQRVDSRGKQVPVVDQRKQRDFRRSEESLERVNQRNMNISQVQHLKAALSKSERKIPRGSPPRQGHKYHKQRD